MKKKPGPKPTHPKTAFLRVRVSDRDRDAFLSASCKAGMTLSEWVLRCCGDAAQAAIAKAEGGAA